MFKQALTKLAARRRLTRDRDALLDALAQAERTPTSTSSEPASSRWRRAGKLGALLAQFPPSFKNARRRATTSRICSARLRDYPVAVELRHRSWSDASARRWRC